MTEWKAGDQVTIKGQQGVYTVKRDTPNKDGSIMLFGGDKNPNGNRGSRDIMPDRLRAVKTKKGGK